MTTRPGITLMDRTRYDFEDPGASQYDINEIARGLSHAARFGGHTKHWFPVAMHCVNGSHIIDPEFAFDFLMHDAVEGLMGFDLATPYKWYIPGFKDLEHRTQEVLSAQFGFTYPFHESVKQADTELLVLENEVLRNGDPLIGVDLASVNVSHLHALMEVGVINMGRVTPDQARELWLQRYEELKP